MVVVDELWAQDSKIAGQSDKTVLRSNSLSFQSGDGLPIVLGVHLWQSLIVKNDRRHFMFPSYLKRSDAWLVTDDNIHPAFSDVLSINGIQDRFKIGAASRDQDTYRNQDYLLVPVRLFLRYTVFLTTRIQCDVESDNSDGGESEKLPRIPFEYRAVL